MRSQHRLSDGRALELKANVEFEIYSATTD